MAPLPTLPIVDHDVSFGDNEGLHASRYLAEITARWGLVEFGLFKLFEATDPERGPELVREFFTSRSGLVAKSRKVSSEVSASAPGTEQEDYVKKLVEDLENLCDRRNLVAHGVWSGNKGSYMIRRLRWDDGAAALAPPETFTLEDLSRLYRDINAMWNRLGWLTANGLAGWLLKELGLPLK